MKGMWHGIGKGRIKDLDRERELGQRQARERAEERIIGDIDWGRRRVACEMLASMGVLEKLPGIEERETRLEERKYEWTRFAAWVTKES